MNRRLVGDDIGKNLPAIVEHGRGGLVAGGFYAKNKHHQQTALNGSS
jgi:hypothetical protein